MHCITSKESVDSVGSHKPQCRRAVLGWQAQGGHFEILCKDFSLLGGLGSYNLPSIDAQASPASGGKRRTQWRIKKLSGFTKE